MYVATNRYNNLGVGLVLAILAGCQAPDGGAMTNEGALGTPCQGVDCPLPGSAHYCSSTSNSDQCLAIIEANYSSSRQEEKTCGSSSGYQTARVGRWVRALVNDRPHGGEWDHIEAELWYLDRQFVSIVYYRNGEPMLHVASNGDGTFWDWMNEDKAIAASLTWSLFNREKEKLLYWGNYCTHREQTLELGVTGNNCIDCKIGKYGLQGAIVAGGVLAGRLVGKLPGALVVGLLATLGQDILKTELWNPTCDWVCKIQKCMKDADACLAKARAAFPPKPVKHINAQGDEEEVDENADKRLFAEEACWNTYLACSTALGGPP
jgi:hypothetical protein